MIEVSTKKVSIGPEGYLLVILTTVLITLKLTHTIDWSWLFVFAPLWMPMLFALVMFTLVLVFILCLFVFALIFG